MISIPGIALTVAMMDGIYRHTESRLNLGTGLKILFHSNRFIRMHIGDSVQFSQCIVDTSSASMMSDTVMCQTFLLLLDSLQQGLSTTFYITDLLVKLASPQAVGESPTPGPQPQAQQSDSGYHWRGPH